MNILVFVKQIPDTTEVKLDPKTGNLCRDGVASVINPLDLNAIEAAMQLKAAHGGRVTAVTMGPPQAREVLLKAMALGCDDAVLLSDRAFGGADTLATAYTLSEAAKKLGQFDLLLFGQHSADGDTAQVGPEIAEKLGIAQLTYVTDIEVEDGGLVCKRMLEDGYMKVRMHLPCLISCMKEIAEPRYMSVKGILDWDDSKLRIIGYDELKTERLFDDDVIGVVKSPTVTLNSFALQKKTGGMLLEGNPADMAAKLFECMNEKHVLD